MNSILTKKPYLTYYQGHSSDPFSMGLSKNGHPIVVWNDSGKARALSSRYDPIEESRRMIPNSIKVMRGTEIIVILGLGNPNILNEIAGMLGEKQICIAIDAFFEMGALLLSNDTVVSYLERPGCHLFCGDPMLETLWTYLQAIPSERISGVRIIEHLPSIHLNEGFYASLREKVQANLEAKLSDLLTRFEFEKLWVGNIINNSRFFTPKAEWFSQGTQSDADDLSFIPTENLAHWHNCLSGIPGLIVAAGPSLRNSVKLIEKLKDRCFVVCCDTAYKVLEKANIIPHAVISLDAQKNTAMHFSNTKHLSETIFFSDIVVNPFVLRKLNVKSVIFSSTAKVIQKADGSIEEVRTAGADYLESIHGPVGQLQSGGSVATNAFDLLRFLGCSEVFLIGQDLAYTGREIHSTGTHHNERWLAQINRTKSLDHINEAVIRKRVTYPVEGIRGGTVLTDYVLDLYRTWFEDSIPRGGLDVTNLTFDGAKINGAKTISDLKTFLSEFKQRYQPIRIDRIFSDAKTLTAHPHPKNKKLYLALKAGSAENQSIDDDSTMAELTDGDSTEFDSTTHHSLFEEFPELKVLLKKEETYIARNASKLNEERKKNLIEKAKTRVEKQLERSVRPYLGSPAQVVRK